MPLTVDDLQLETGVPDLPDAIPIFDLATPSFRSRVPGMSRLADALQLEALRTVDLDDAVVMGSERGDIQFFRPSGSVWGRDATAASEHHNELRRWPRVRRTTRGDNRVRLDAATSRHLLETARDVFDATGLIGREGVAGGGVDLEQVAHLDEEGRETVIGAGQATVKLWYEAEGLPVRGAGAKTMLFADPAPRDGLRVTGVFHAWRPLASARRIKLPPLERALRHGLLIDPELERYHRSEHRIVVHRLELCYLALPAFVRQDHLFPAFQVEGEVSEGVRGQGFRFGRFHHVLRPQDYHRVDLYAPYLVANPDGISRRGRASRR